MAVFFDRRAAEEGERMLGADFAQAVRLDRPLAGQPWGIRVGAPIARLFSPLL
jgi:cardiolipin synthase